MIQLLLSMVADAETIKEKGFSSYTPHTVLYPWPKQQLHGIIIIALQVIGNNWSPGTKIAKF